MTLLTASASAMAAAPKSYPAAPQNPVTDRYFDIEVVDRFRPLEQDTAAATLAWVEAERDVTRQYLDQIPYRDALRQALTVYNNYGKQGLPAREADGRYYMFNNDGLANQSILYRSDTPDGPRTVFLDPNKLSDDGTVALNGVSMSPDGRYTAYIISRSGSDWSEIYVLDTETGRLLDDHIMWAKFTGASWYKDGFFYSAYPAPAPGMELSAANENHLVYYHRIGTPQSADELVYSDREHPLHFHSAYVPDDSDILAVYASGQGFGNAVYLKNLADPESKWVTMYPNQDIAITPIGIRDGRLYFITSYGAPRNRLMSAPVNDPTRDQWTVVVPEQKGVLTGAQFSKNDLVLTYDTDASQHAYIYGLDGTLRSEIALPTYGTIAVSASPKYDDVFYSFTSFLYPTSIYSYDKASGKSTPLYKPEIQGFNPDDYVTEQVFYTSQPDGAKIPMFITRRRDLRPDGTNPVYLYGYGGFDISLNPGFSANRLLWLDNGGIYAQANLRGGGEYGEEWHAAGTKLNKLNVFNDFISAAQYMIDKGWTTPRRIAIEGGSNGGLLVGAVTNMRPDLFSVAIPRVGVMDMLRYHLFTVGWNWAPDYGTVDDSPEMAAYLRAYSPMHNIRNGVRYPAIMVTTADHDDRVVPAHSFKYAAELQAADTGDAPKIIRIDSKAGHGAGKPIAKVIDEFADIYSFIFYNMGITPRQAR